MSRRSREHDDVARVRCEERRPDAGDCDILDFAAYGIVVNLALFAGAAVTVWIFGTRITGHVDALASRTRLDQAFAGMLLLGGITSLPEASAVVTSAATGDAPMAVNNLLGSVSTNIVLIAAADAVLGRAAITSEVATPTTLMQGTLGILAALLVVTAILVGDIDVVGVGAWSLGLVAFCIAAFWLSSRYADRAPWHLVDPPPENGGVASAEEPGRSVVELSLSIGLSAVAILVAGFVLSRSADAIAAATGLGSGLIGFVLVGFATSLPELSTITEAVRRRRYEMALGDVFGTNLLTYALVFVADLAYAGGPLLATAGRFEAVAGLLGAFLSGVFVIGLLERGNRTILRMGYDSLAAILSFASGLALLYHLSG